MADTTPSSALVEHEEQLALLLADLADRAQRGERVDLESQCRAHPELASELRELWGVCWWLRRRPARR